MNHVEAAVDCCCSMWVISTPVERCRRQSLPLQPPAAVIRVEASTSKEALTLLHYRPLITVYSIERVSLRAIFSKYSHHANRIQIEWSNSNFVHIFLLEKYRRAVHHLSLSLHRVVCRYSMETLTEYIG
jgi:hypothetical protein